MFREKDMGNLIQLLFTCGDYFVGKNIEMVTDSHFGHLVPVAYMRLLKVYATSSFSIGQRIGVSNISELSKVPYNKDEKRNMIETHRKILEENEDKFDPYDDASEAVENDIQPYGIPKSKKKMSLRSVHTPLQLFEKELSMKPRGSYKVWTSTFSIAKKLKVTLYLHAVNDSKPVFRLSSKYGALPKCVMTLTDEKKVRNVVSTSGAHKSFRKNMGNNDQSDAKRAVLGLSGKYYRRWPMHPLSKTIEDGIINSYLNYLLDPSCAVEPWPTFLYNLVQELIDTGEDLRMNKNRSTGYKRFRGGELKRPVAGSDMVLERGCKCRGGLAGVKWLPKDDRTAQCAFCGKKKAMYKCRACSMHLCMTPPRDLSASGGRKFPMNGPVCFQRYHGISKYTQ